MNGEYELAIDLGHVVHPATAALVKIAEGVTRDLYRFDPDFCFHFLEVLTAKAKKATDDASRSGRQFEIDRAHVKWAEVRAAEAVFDQLTGGAGS